MAYRRKIRCTRLYNSNAELNKPRRLRSGLVLALIGAMRHCSHGA